VGASPNTLEVFFVWPKRPKYCFFFQNIYFSDIFLFFSGMCKNDYCLKIIYVGYFC